MTDKPYRPIEPVYRVLASLVDALSRCTPEWDAEHRVTIENFIDNFLPSGAGWDCGTKIDLGSSTGEKIVFYGEYHHMDDDGYYDGWTDHRIAVRPSLVFGISLAISGRNRNEIKDYLHEQFDCALRQNIQWSDDAGRYVSVD